jgi:hypothetical protein
MAKQKSCVVFDAEKLALARKKAIEEDIRNIPLAGNLSGFVRWLIERYLNEKKEAE